MNQTSATSEQNTAEQRPQTEAETLAAEIKRVSAKMLETATTVLGSPLEVREKIFADLKHETPFELARLNFLATDHFIVPGSLTEFENMLRKLQEIFTHPGR